MRPIPKAQRGVMADDPYFKTCCLEKHLDDSCEGRIEFHHNLILAGRQSNEYWSILPLCHKHHMQADKSDMKELLNWIMLNRAGDLQLREISKAIDYKALRDRLNKKYA